MSQSDVYAIWGVRPARWLYIDQEFIHRLNTWADSFKGKELEQWAENHRTTFLNSLRQLHGLTTCQNNNGACVHGS